MISIKLSMRGKPTPRARVGKYGGYYKEDYISYKKALRIYFKAFKSMGNSRIRVELCFFFKPSKTAKRNKYYTPPYDVDNLAKAVLDAGNGILYDDDVLIEELIVKKKYTEGKDCIYLNLKEVE